MKLRKIMIPLVVLLVVAAISAGAAYYFAGGKKLPINFNWLSAMSTQAKGKEFGPIIDVGQFTVNLQGDSSFLKTDISLELGTKKDEEAIKDLMPVVKDSIVGVLANKTLEDVRTTKGKESLRTELLAKINQAFGVTRVKNVLFTSYVFQ